MVEGKHLADEDITDAEIEALIAMRPKRSEEELKDEMEEWLKHPLNCRELTPQMLERPEFQALSAMAHEGTPDEVAVNLLKHGLEQLSRVLLKGSKN